MCGLDWLELFKLGLHRVYLNTLSVPLQYCLHHSHTQPHPPLNPSTVLLKTLGVQKWSFFIPNEESWHNCSLYCFFQDWNSHKKEEAGLLSSLNRFGLGPSGCHSLAASSDRCSSHPPHNSPTCWAGEMQRMDSWVLVWRGTPCLSQGTVMCSVEGDWKR